MAVEGWSLDEVGLLVFQIEKMKCNAVRVSGITLVESVLDPWGGR